jgi:glycosyltransferase involved in cell wall biosynthesis
MHVCVGIPTVNRLGFLREALESVRAQTYRDFHVVISENSGQAGYARDVDALAREYSEFPVEVVHQVPQLAMNVNSNALLDASRGDAWAYLPDDDLLCPDFLEVTVGLLRTHPSAAFAFSDHFLMDSEGRVDAGATEANSVRWGRSDIPDGLVPPERMLRLALRQSLEWQSILFRMETIRAFRIRVEAGTVPDFDLELRLCAAPERLQAVYSSKRLTKYRIHGGQETVAMRQKAVHLDSVACLERLRKIPWADRQAFRRKLAGEYRALATLAAREGASADAMRHAGRALELDPTPRRVLEWAALGMLPPDVLTRAAAVIQRRRKG